MTVCVAVLLEPTVVISAVNAKVAAPWGLTPIPPANTEQGVMLYFVTSAIALIYILNGVAGNETFATNSIFVHLAVASVLAVFISERVIGNGWNILVAQETGAALISTYFSFALKQSRKR